VARPEQYGPGEEPSIGPDPRTRGQRASSVRRDCGQNPHVPGVVQRLEVVEGLHGLLDRGAGFEPVDLTEVDVVHVEAAQAVLGLREDRGSGQAGVLGPPSGPRPPRIRPMPIMRRWPTTSPERVLSRRRPPKILSQRSFIAWTRHRQCPFWSEARSFRVSPLAQATSTRVREEVTGVPGTAGHPFGVRVRPGKGGIGSSSLGCVAGRSVDGWTTQ
jgi:hypothetical protein